MKRSGRLFFLVSLFLLAACDRAPSASPASRTSTPSPLPPTATARPVPTVIVPPTDEAEGRAAEAIVVTPTGNPLADAELLAETGHFDLYGRSAETAAVIAALEPEIETIYRFVSERLNGETRQRIAILIQEPRDKVCPMRGSAGIFDDNGRPVPIIFVYATDQAPSDELRAILAHEVGHILHHQGAVGGPSGNHLLDEGLPSWAAGDYWAEWFGADVDALVQSYREEMRFMPLRDHPSLQIVYQDLIDDRPGCLERRNILYNEAASFLGFLIDRHGIEKLSALMEDTRQRQEAATPPLPDYEAVYGYNFAALEALWLHSLEN